MSFYKYFPCYPYHFTAFGQRELFFAKPFLFNDCFDTAEVLYSSFKKFCNLMGWGSAREIPQINNHGICCFTKASSADSLRMWNLYAKAMNGFALEFDEKALSHEDLMNIHLIPVKYRKHPLNLNNIKSVFRIEGERFTISDCIERPRGKEIDRLFEYLHVCKDRKQWACENEWRMIIGECRIAKNLKESEQRDGYLLTLPTNPYLSITIGHMVYKDKRLELKEIADGYNIPIYIARPAIVGRNWGVRIDRY